MSTRIQQGVNTQKPQDQISPQQPQKQQGTGLQDNFAHAKLNESFRNANVFKQTVTDRPQFNELLSMVGKLPYAQRDNITKNMNAVLNLDASMLQNPEIVDRMTTLLKNVPRDTPNFIGLVNNMMLKTREFMIKNRPVLNLFEPQMAALSESLRRFLNLVPEKAKNDFFNSLDTQLMNFILGKADDDMRKRFAEQQKSVRTKKKKGTSLIEEEGGTAGISTNEGGFYDDDDEEEEDDGHDERMERLLRIMFSDVMRLEPELISAVMMTLVSQLPYGRFLIEDNNLKLSWLEHTHMLK